LRAVEGFVLLAAVLTAKPRNALFRVLPAAEAFFLRELDNAGIRVAIGWDADFRVSERGEARENE
jgi:hypothetical protein